MLQQILYRLGGSHRILLQCRQFNKRIVSCSWTSYQRSSLASHNRTYFKWPTVNFASHGDIFECRSNVRYFTNVSPEEAQTLSLSNHGKFSNLVSEYSSIKNIVNEKNLSSDSFTESCVKSVCQSLDKYTQTSEDINQLKAMIAEGGDTDIIKMAHEDIEQLKAELKNLEQDHQEVCLEDVKEYVIYSTLVSDAAVEHDDLVLEVIAGVGGQEAMLFTKEIFEMYLSYAARKGWTCQVISSEYTDIGGLRHATVNISGSGAYADLKFEGGVHRVQRVPKTERSGRVHTSTMTVAVLPQPREVDIYINPKDLKIETCRASGKGGQHVNTTDSAVRVVHLPTGISAECQAERSQLRNRESALRLLSSRLYEIEQDKVRQKHVTTRKLQIGSASRNEKIRTYNVKDDRVTDHRVKDNLWGVEEFLQGGALVEQLMEGLKREAKIEELGEKLDKLTELFSNTRKH